MTIYKCRCGVRFKVETPIDGMSIICRKYGDRVVRKYNEDTGEPYDKVLPDTCREEYVLRQTRSGKIVLFRINPDNAPMPTQIQAPATLG